MAAAEEKTCADSVIYDTVLFATGRVPETKELGLVALDVVSRRAERQDPREQGEVLKRCHGGRRMVHGTSGRG